MQRYAKSFAFKILYGLAVHFGLGLLFLFILPTHVPVKVELKKVPVQLRIQEKPLGSYQSLPSAPAPRATAKQKAKSTRGSESDPLEPKPSLTQQKYTELIPKAQAGQLGLAKVPAKGPASLIAGSHQFKPGSTGLTRQNLVIDASILSAAFDVPLLARRISSGSEAFLRIDRISPARLRIISLRGDPILRAVIFESLHKEEVHALILRLMDELGEKSLPLVLQSLSGAGDRMQNELDFTWNGRKLIIRKTSALEFKLPAGAIQIPDEEAKKAKIRDRLHLESIQRSPAYRSTLHNFDVELEETKSGSE